MCGVSDRVISVTIIAIGTSLPELVTTLTAIAKKQGSLSAGNIIGANIIDLTLILPVCALIYGSKLPASPTVAMVDIPACLIIGILSVCLLYTSHRNAALCKIAKRMCQRHKREECQHNVQ